MQDIRVYRYDGTLLKIIPHYVRLSWAEHLRDAGAVSLTLAAPHPLYDLLTENPYVLLNWDGKFATVTSFSCKEQEITVSAETLTTLLKRRVIPEESFSLTGTAEACVRQLLAKYAPFLNITSQADKTAVKTVTFSEQPDSLFAAITTCLNGTGIGIHIGFDKGVFKFKFVYPTEKALRLSAGNRNAHGVRMSVYFDAVQTAGYYTEHFYPTEDLELTGGLADGKPENYMKQYYVVSEIWLSGKQYDKGTYLYCDTPDGIFKTASTEQQSRVRYVSVTDANPLSVFEKDFRELSRQKVEEKLMLRRYTRENWSVQSKNVAFVPGDVVVLEKTVGTEKGVRRLEVTETVYDSQSQVPTVRFTQFEG